MGCDCGSPYIHNKGEPLYCLDNFGGSMVKLEEKHAEMDQYFADQVAERQRKAKASTLIFLAMAGSFLLILTASVLKFYWSCQ